MHVSVLWLTDGTVLIPYVKMSVELQQFLAQLELTQQTQLHALARLAICGTVQRECAGVGLAIKT
jgi:hypothetical protein